jgi:adenylate cyclase class 2
MQEIETKVLEVDKNSIILQMQKLGAKKILDTRLVVDWYGPKGLTHNGDDPWYLRIRENSQGQKEVSWKSLAKVVGNTRQSEEINFNVSDGEKIGELLKILNLENYAHQEKDRISWQYENWQFDLDTYPKMPPYLEIEGQSHEHIQEAIKLLHLEKHESISDGETKLIQEKYKLNWNDMRF